MTDEEKVGQLFFQLTAGMDEEYLKELMEKYPRCRVFLDIFDGGHEIDMEMAMYWFLSQYRKKELTKVTG